MSWFKQMFSTKWEPSEELVQEVKDRVEKERKEREEEKKKRVAQSVEEIQMIEDVWYAPTADRLTNLENKCKAEMERAYRESNGKTPHILCRTKHLEMAPCLSWESSFERLQARGRFNNMKLTCVSRYTEYDQLSGDYSDRPDPNGFYMTQCELTILHL